MSFATLPVSCPPVHPSDQLTSGVSHAFKNAETCCSLIWWKSFRSCSLKGNAGFTFIIRAHSSVSVLESEMDDPTVAPLIKPNRSNQSFHLLFDQPTHTKNRKIKFQVYLTMWVICCSVSLLIKNVGVILFVWQNINLDCWLLVSYNKQQLLLCFLHCIAKKSLQIENVSESMYSSSIDVLRF